MTAFSSDARTAQRGIGTVAQPHHAPLEPRRWARDFLQSSSKAAQFGPAHVVARLFGIFNTRSRCTNGLPMEFGKNAIPICASFRHCAL
jgi:hypothetical protein